VLARAIDNIGGFPGEGFRAKFESGGNTYVQALALP